MKTRKPIATIWMNQQHDPRESVHVIDPGWTIFGKRASQRVARHYIGQLTKQLRRMQTVVTPKSAR
jgi:hypothetical protein